MSPLGKRNYIVLFGFLGLICLSGLWIPLMDNDAAHHANIALRMYITGDYVNLIDNGKDYLDKPHLHFWLAAISYKIFGVNEVAYKLPSFLISIGGLYSLYKLGSLLYNQETGRLTALILGTAFAFVISLSDVRMDAILVAAICFACWQLIETVVHKRWYYIVGSAVGLAIGFSVKGSIGIFVPLMFLTWYVIEKKQIAFLYSIRFMAILLLSALFITPVLCCYYIQFNLHPEKTIRGRDHIDGVRFALFGGGAERFAGGMSQDSKKDLLFFFYTFLWAFAPWSVLAYMGIVRTIREKKQWFISATIVTLALLIGLAGSKLPHYLNISFPFAALLVAALINEKPLSKTVKAILYSMVAILLISTVVVNGWLFPDKLYRLFFWGGILMVGSLLSRKTAKDTTPFTSVLMACFFLYLFLNSNFYPKLLEYQGGQELAEKTKNKVLPGNVFFWKDNFSSSYCFATKTLRKELTGRADIKNDTASYLIYDIAFEKAITDSGWVLGEKTVVKDFEITKLDKEFADPETRDAHCSSLVMARLDSFRKP
jgi:4-amino-4-deoxy-L-arabinose transferase-like glycosyltransferase